MKPVKVLLVITLSEIGGAQKVIYHIAVGLDPGLFNVTVACAPGGELIRWLCQMPRKIRIVEIPELKRNISPFFDLVALYRLYHLIRRERFDIVHCHSSKAGILGRLAAGLAGVKKIFFTVHGWGINQYQSWPVRFFYAWLERLAGTVSTKVVCVSESDLSKGRSLRLVTDDKLSVIYNGVTKPQKKEGVLRRELNIKKEDIIVGTVARLTSQKAPLFLLEVAERIINRPNNGLGKGRVYFVIIGDGPLRHQCEEFINIKGLNGRVFLLGAKEEAAELVQDFDVFALFSRWEGLPLTIIEAMLARVPVVARAVGGVNELVMHQKTGYLINKLDVGEAEKVILDLVSNKHKRQTMGEFGCQRATQLFGIDEMVTKYRELYLS